MYGLTLLSVALVAGQAAASAVYPRSPLASLLRVRQAGFDPSDIPAQCQSDCSVISTALNSASCSTDISCLCSSSTNTGLYNCLECALSIDPDQATLTEVQESYDEYTQACSSANAPVAANPLTIPSGSAAATSGSAQGTNSNLPVSASATAAPTSTAGGSVGTKTVVTGAAQSTGSGSDSGVSDPLSGSGSSGDGAQKNGAGLGAAMSSVGVAGVVGAMFAVLAL
ncbi:hypothetical protein BV20DRAFT_966320 [Pilatotrama ljubarskyi]|nr:hypothetical protein BV20DRAFT_966320 [Pilatotrama ljubarskyi]